MLGKIEGRRNSVGEDEMVGWHHHSTDINLSKLQEILEDREAWRVAVHGGCKESDVTKRLNNILTYILSFMLRFHAIQHYNTSNVI